MLPLDEEDYDPKMKRKEDLKSAYYTGFLTGMIITLVVIFGLDVLF